MMLFREATPNDIEGLHIVRVAVKENALSDPSRITHADYEEFLTRRGKGWLCETENRIAGFAICDLQDENIWALFVHPECEKRGIARTLQKHMLDWYFMQKEKVWLSTSPGTRAEKFYRTSGWRANGLHGKEIRFEMTREEWSLLPA